MSWRQLGALSRQMQIPASKRLVPAIWVQVVAINVPVAIGTPLSGIGQLEYIQKPHAARQAFLLQAGIEFVQHDKKARLDFCIGRQGCPRGWHTAHDQMMPSTCGLSSDKVERRHNSGPR